MCENRLQMTEENIDEQYMQRAIGLAKKGVGYTNPNPMVGAVIVKDGRIIGEGYHHRCGELHAERNALASLTESAAGADLYVTLEPCCHHGKTPPCTDAIIEHGIGRVFIGSRDPNPLVAGKGAKILREHGITVVEDVCREDCDAINPVFFHYITKKRPYVVMKYAMTLDGKIATRTGSSKWITGEKARQHVHILRGRYAAILCGIGTVLADDPMLNARLEGAHQPLRIVLDSHLRIPMDARLVTTAKEYPTMVVCADAAETGSDKATDPEKTAELPAELSKKKALLEKAGVTVLSLPEANGKVDLDALMTELGNRKIDSVLVEGGGQIHEAFRSAGLVNHVCCYIAPKLFGGATAKSPIGGPGVSEPDEATLLQNGKITLLGQDLLMEYDCEVK